ncbi:DNA cytosine methyltransferase [Pedobacter zeae]|uniref:Cytosine-specific methyltransferase n=1 Tax=Pedobacter zeae TaxID=1737356 RepID=A0A7W6P3L5_9SPHI|nr:DNA cytosine methyltransferase [Pedobacter zeae]MBB4106609.1 DNA (cytosine-5)-methyltransferase 1 [Pedobacter zeae]GGH02686.1 restriction endonuclease subunit M [Pedobacter zeae]
MNYIDLFAGAGGLSEGFKRAGYSPVAHVEIDVAASYSLRTRAAYYYLKESDRLNHYHSYLKGDITRKDLYSLMPQEILDSVINLGIGDENNQKIFSLIDKNLQGNNEIDLIVGGPPCQAYSLVGRARSEHGMKKDSRNFLYVQYANYLEKYKPKMFVFENVLGLKSAGGGVYLQNMEKLFYKKGYSIHIFSVKAENFGVLQKRRRLIIIGWRKDFIPNLPDLDNYKSGLTANVSSLFADLPAIQAGEGKDKFLNYTANKNEYLEAAHIRNEITTLTQHIARPHALQDKEIYRIAVDKWNNDKERLNYNDLPDRLKTHENRSSFFDRFKVVAADLEASQTVVAHIAKDGHYYIHPDELQNRSISVREAARLQSFPDDFYFEGVKEGANRTAAFKQIGNAVPCLLGQQIAVEIKDLL